MRKLTITAVYVNGYFPGSIVVIYSFFFLFFSVCLIGSFPFG